MSSQPLPRPIEAVPAVAAVPRPEAVLVDVVLLSADPHLFQALRDAVGERNPVWRARSAEEAANLLITGRCGVLVIDTATVSSRADTLIEQIVEQFPDVVVCVAGTRDDEPLLAPLISHGLVYRFMHKPTSARRAGMFLQAAIRRHVEQREGGQVRDPLRPLLGGPHRPAAGMRGRVDCCADAGADGAPVHRRCASRYRAARNGHWPARPGASPVIDRTRRSGPVTRPRGIAGRAAGVAGGTERA